MAVELNNLSLILTKCGKLTAYKGMLDYVKTHKDDSIYQPDKLGSNFITLH